MALRLEVRRVPRHPSDTLKQKYINKILLPYVFFFGFLIEAEIFFFFFPLFFIDNLPFKY